MKSYNFKNLFIVVILTAIIPSCTKDRNEKSSSKSVQTNQIGKDSLLKLLPGEYTGTLPCADCEIIKNNLSLQPSMDFTSELIYVGKNVNPLVTKGIWRIMDDSLIMLESTTDIPTFLKIFNKDSLLMLDDSLKRMTGPLASMFVLRRGGSIKGTSNDTVSSSTIPNKNFILDTINGRKASEKDYMNGLPELKIDSKNNTVSGSTGCNKLNGKVIINNNEISFSEFAMTRMMCPGTGESEFIKALKSIKTYKFENTKLYLMNGDKSILVFKEDSKN